MTPKISVGAERLLKQLRADCVLRKTMTKKTWAHIAEISVATKRDIEVEHFKHEGFWITLEEKAV